VLHRAALPGLLSGLRLFLIPILSWAAFAGDGRLVGVGLLVAGATDFLDGFFARRLGVAGPAGARLDALADNLLLLAAAAWMLWLHPEITDANGGLLLLLTAAVVYVFSLVAAAIRFGRTNIGLVSSRVAGGCLYAFALFTFMTGDYEPALLAVVVIALLISSTETLLAAWRPGRRLADLTITEVIATARKQRSHTPHAVNPVGASTNATASSTDIATPSAGSTHL